MTSPFLPATREDLDRLGIDRPDIIIVTGDAYIDSPYIGAAVIGRVLQKAGFTVGIIAQPTIEGASDIMRLGEPNLFWGITGGSVDSMVANHTAIGKPRKSDDYTPGGVNNARPDRAVLRYANLVKQHASGDAKLVLGGIEASLRRLSHYDAWSDRIRGSILLDAKADYLLYGMADRAVVRLAEALRDGTDPASVENLCYVASACPDGAVMLPSLETVRDDNDAFTTMFTEFSRAAEPASGITLCQPHGNRVVIQNPPGVPLSTDELNDIHDLGFTREVHPLDAAKGEVKAQQTIKFSVASHRGCFGGCAFCAIAAHQGRHITSRSESSVAREVERITKIPGFTGIIGDVGGPTANMYGMGCARPEGSPPCGRKCLHPNVCPNLKVDHGRLLKLLSRVRRVPGVKRAFVASGVRHDLALADRQRGGMYIEQLVMHHISGQLKLAPEHTVDAVLKRMGKPRTHSLTEFRKRFDKAVKNTGQQVFLTYYLMAAHPGCSKKDMEALASACQRDLGHIPEQVQIFTPTPSTRSTLMYVTGRDPDTGEAIFVERSVGGRTAQKEALHGRRTATPSKRGAPRTPPRTRPDKKGGSRSPKR